MTEHTLTFGVVAPGFEPVGEAFDDVVSQSAPGGAALHVRINGQAVVDRWGGMARTDRPWTAATPTVLFSCSKGVLAVLAGMLVEDGVLDLDEAACQYWPEFAAAGKGDLTVRDLLAHRAGLPVLRADLSRRDIIDWQRMTGLLAAEAPLFPPGSTHQYHALTVGWLVGEVLVRVSGRSVGELLSERIVRPLDVPLYIGAPAEVLPAVADSVVLDQYWPREPRPAPDASDLERLADRALTLGHGLPRRFADPGQGFNDPVVRQAQIPGAGAIGTARALSTMWSATICDGERVRLLRDEVIEDMCRPVSEGLPALPTVGPWHRWGAGFMLASDLRPMLSAGSFGHDGLGGQLAFADAASGVGFAFVSNGLRLGKDDRARVLVDALRDAMNCLPSGTSAAR